MTNNGFPNQSTGHSVLNGSGAFSSIYADSQHPAGIALSKKISGLANKKGLFKIRLPCRCERFSSIDGLTVGSRRAPVSEATPQVGY